MVSMRDTTWTLFHAAGSVVVTAATANKYRAFLVLEQEGPRARSGLVMRGVFSGEGSTGQGEGEGEGNKGYTATLEEIQAQGTKDPFPRTCHGRLSNFLE